MRTKAEALAKPMVALECITVTQRDGKWGWEIRV